MVVPPSADRWSANFYGNYQKTHYYSKSIHASFKKYSEMSVLQSHLDQYSGQ